mmetsp:Transcript_10339/g.19558  ORF Transcript_10339/g.19558 Transcript_10339/m.19558 type:complete len:1655 (-) Transcript_10339:285-5249(-)|eukprot:CAMPEP_0175148318 /NCGR_PEP_ID=MMETSP0087-20121206/16552_1 /TAXON_ID=136419 /ORGANISM="Unknown Unknown, Strain D1" /LENGTH=1654 /DNA_ID=CAMNT_0016433747 /DNA_START=101 /DNA_END=5065 /DNA_ORIENTATION=-
MSAAIIQSTPLKEQVVLNAELNRTRNALLKTSQEANNVKEVLEDKIDFITQKANKLSADNESLRKDNNKLVGFLKKFDSSVAEQFAKHDWSWCSNCHTDEDSRSRMELSEQRKMQRGLAEKEKEMKSLKMELEKKFKRELKEQEKQHSLKWETREKEIFGTRKRFNSQLAQSTDAKNKAEAEVKRLRKQIDSNSKIVGSYEQEIALLKKKISEIQKSNYVESQENYEEFNHKTSESSVRINRLVEQNTALHTKIEQLNKKLIERSQLNKEEILQTLDAEKKVLRLQKNLDVLNIDKNVRAQLQALSSENSTLREKMVSVKQREATIDDREAAYTSQIAQLQREATQSVEQHESTLKVLTSKINDLQALSDDQSQRYETDLTDKNLKIQELKAELEETQAELREQVQQFDTYKESAKSALGSYASQIEVLETAQEQTLTDFDKMQTSLETEKMEICQLLKIAESNMELAAKEHKAELNRLNENHDNELSVAKAKFEAEIQNHKDSISSLHKDLNAEKSRRDEDTQKNLQLVEQLKTEAAKDAHNMAADFSERSNTMKATHEAKVAAMQATIDRTQADHEQDVQRLTNELKATQTELVQLETKSTADAAQHVTVVEKFVKRLKTAQQSTRDAEEKYNRATEQAKNDLQEHKRQSSLQLSECENSLAKTVQQFATKETSLKEVISEQEQRIHELQVGYQQSVNDMMATQKQVVSSLQNDIRDLNANYQQTVASYNSKIEGLQTAMENSKAAFESTIEELTSGHTSSIDAMTASHQQQIVQMTSEFESAVAEHESHVQKMTVQHKSDIKNLINQHQAQVQTLESATMEMQTQHKLAIANMMKVHSEEAQRKQNEHDAAIAGLSAQHNSAMEVKANEFATMVSEKNASLEKLKLEHQCAAEKMVKQHQDSMHRVGATHQTALQNLKDKFQDEKDSMEAEFESRLGKLMLAYEDEITLKKATHKQEMSTLESQHSAQIAAVEKAHQESEKVFKDQAENAKLKFQKELLNKDAEIAKVQRNGEAHLVEQEQKFHGQIKQMQTQHDEEIWAKKLETENRMNELRANHQHSTQELQMSFAQTLRKQQVKHLDEVDNINNQHNEQVTSLQASALAAKVQHEAVVVDLVARNKATIANIVSEKDEEVATLKADAQKRIQSMTKDQAEQVEQLMTTHQQQVNQLTSAAAAAKEQFDKHIRDLISSHNSTVATMEANFGNLANQHQLSQKEHQESVVLMRNQHAAEKADAQQVHHEQLHKLQEQHTQDVNRMHAEFEHKVSNLEAHYAAQKEKSSSEFEEERKTLKVESEQAIRAVQEQLQQQLQTVKINSERKLEEALKQLKEVEEACSRKLTTKDQQFEMAKAEYKANLLSVHKDIEVRSDAHKQEAIRMESDHKVELAALAADFERKLKGAKSNNSRRDMIDATRKIRQLEQDHITMKKQHAVQMQRELSKAVKNTKDEFVFKGKEDVKKAIEQTENRLQNFYKRELEDLKNQVAAAKSTKGNSTTPRVPLRAINENSNSASDAVQKLVEVANQTEICDDMLRLKKTEGENVYTFGVRKLHLCVINDRLTVRVGGGYMSFSEFSNKYGKQEAQRLSKASSTMKNGHFKAVSSTLKYVSPAVKTIMESAKPKTRFSAAINTATNTTAVSKTLVFDESEQENFVVS